MRSALLTSLLLAAMAGPAAAQESAAECAELDNDRERLACYDRFFSSGGNLGESSTTPGSRPVEADFGRRPVRSSRSAVRATPAPGGDFGLEKSPLELGGEELTSVAQGTFSRWERGQKVRLANGQVWEITNSTGVYYPVSDPKVTIKKGLFSAFYLHVDGISKSLKVRRIR